MPRPNDIKSKNIDQINKNFNLILDNPFVPKNKNLQNQPKGPLKPSQSPINQGQILQKYLEFKSILLLIKRNFSVFLTKGQMIRFGFLKMKFMKTFELPILTLQIIQSRLQMVLIQKY